MGSVKVTSGAYHESTMGLKNDVYSLARTRFSFVTVAANSSFSVVVDDVGDPVASVVDMKSLVRCCCCVEEEGEQNASAAGLVAARSSSSSEPKSDSAVDCFVIMVA
eukprot:scaffold14899_cov66-Skeletonema_marinoi.AAC.1